MPIDLSEISTNPEDRKKVIYSQNKANLDHAQFLQNISGNVQAAKRKADIANTDIELQKIIYQQQTAEMVQEVNSTYQPLMEEGEKTLQEAFKRNNQVMRDLQRIDIARQQDNLTWSERRKLDKEYNELNEEAYRTARILEFAGQDQMILNHQANITTKALLESREAQFQASLDVESIRNSLELTQKLELMQLDVDFQTQAVAAINRLQTLSAQEIAAGKAEDQGRSIFEFMHFMENRGVNLPKEMGKGDIARYSAFYDSMAPAERHALMEGMMLYQRAKNKGVPLTHKDLMNVVLHDGKVSTAMQFADLSGDKDLRGALQVGVEAAVEDKVRQSVLAYQKAEAAKQKIADPSLIPVPAQDMQVFRETATEQVMNGYSTAVLPHAIQYINKDMTEKANALGQDIYPTSPEAIGMLIPPGKYSPGTEQALRSPEFAAIFQQQNAEDGNAIATTSQKMVDALTAKTGNRAEAIAAAADFNRAAAESRYRQNNGRFSAISDTLKQYGVSDDTGKLQITLPAHIRGSSFAEDKDFRASYDGGNPTDLQALLSLMRKYKNYNEQTAEKYRQYFENRVVQYPTVRPPVFPEYRPETK